MNTVKNEVQNEASLTLGSNSEYLQMYHLYSAAISSFRNRLEILNDELNMTFSRNPIHHIEGRVKSPASIIDKLKKKNAEISLLSAKENINDLAGIRIVCCFIDDVYRVEEMLMRQPDIVLEKRQDYIKNPNYNGYRSLHLDLRVPVYLSDHTENVLIEVQLRTIAMDFWASLEHDLRYKVKNKETLPEGINEEMLACAGDIAVIDEKMQQMHNRIHKDS